MLRLPNELILLILSHASTPALWALTQVSCRIRFLAILPFLERHSISESDIKSGTITLRTPSFFLILVVARLNKIQKLSLAKFVYSDGLVSVLGAILSATETIPEIFIEAAPSNCGGLLYYLLASIAQATSRTLVITTDSPLVTSYPRQTSPLHWQPVPSIRAFLQYFATRVPSISHLIMEIPFAAQLCLGRNWKSEARLAYDLRSRPEYRILPSLEGHSFRIQTVGKDFTFLTVPTWASGAHTIRPVPGLGPDKLSAVVAAIDSNPFNTQICVETSANIRHCDLLLLLCRHPNLQVLDLRLDSIRPSSLIIPDASATCDIVSLSAPALYIPHIVPSTPLLRSIWIEFHPMPMHFFSSRVALSVSEYKRSLDSVLSLPGTHPLTLTLSFPANAHNPPWLDIIDKDDAVEARLHRVTELLLTEHPLDIGAGFGVESFRALPRWLRLFPALQRVTIHPGDRHSLAIPPSEERELLKAISDSCRGGHNTAN
ncbi:hypothetical protein K438DRAFT_1961463 [Mycena galopus ATCC 62051]|nr:hypothetical protein K438DRAFT_1961463 [Mycena galopus ATCC 62051]